MYIVQYRDKVFGVDVALLHDATEYYRFLRAMILEKAVVLDAYRVQIISATPVN